jgi:hypothetical protein
VLTKMLRLAYEHGKRLRLPVIRKLREATPRAGFCEPEVFAAIRRRLPEVPRPGSRLLLHARLAARRGVRARVAPPGPRARRGQPGCRSIQDRRGAGGVLAARAPGRAPRPPGKDRGRPAAARPRDPPRVRPSQGEAGGSTHWRLPEAVGEGLHRRRRAGAAGPRSPAIRGPRHGARRHHGGCGHEDFRPPNPQRVRPLQHHLGERPPDAARLMGTFSGTFGQS